MEKYFYIAPLTNAKGSFLQLDLGKQYTIERWSKSKLVKYLKFLEDLPKYEIEFRLENNHCFPNDRKYAYVITGKIFQKNNQIDSTEEFIKWFKKTDQINRELNDKIKILRLLKEGHIEIFGFYVYSFNNGTDLVMDSSMTHTKPIEKLSYLLTPSNVLKANHIVKEIQLPFTQNYLQLAFNSFIESYDYYEHERSFLSLMIALEALFTVGRQELRYRISRNIAVLLGWDRDSSKYYFNKIKKMYDKRSKLLHTGDSTQIHFSDMLNCRNVVRQSILKINSMGLEKEKISELLNETGFGDFEGICQ